MLKRTALNFAPVVVIPAFTEFGLPARLFIVLTPLRGEVAVDLDINRNPTAQR
jgi:hypothetical protein